MSAWGVVVAGGSGARFGALKQLEPLGDRRVLDHSIAALSAVCDGVVVVAPADLVNELELASPTVVVVAGGATRSDSVRAGLRAVGPEASHVLVHDAARPLASEALVRRVVTALDVGAVAVVPVVPVGDSLRTVAGVPVDRADYVAVQTPQGFDKDALMRAHHSAEVASDDAALIDRLGLDVVHVEGEATNIKITEPHDLLVAEVLLRGD